MTLLSLLLDRCCTYYFLCIYMVQTYTSTIQGRNKNMNKSVINKSSRNKECQNTLTRFCLVFLIIHTKLRRTLSLHLACVDCTNWKIDVWCNNSTNIIHNAVETKQANGGSLLRQVLVVASIHDGHIRNFFHTMPSILAVISIIMSSLLFVIINSHLFPLSCVAYFWSS